METCKTAIEVYIINSWHTWLRVCFLVGIESELYEFLMPGCIKPVFVFGTFVYNGLSTRSQVSNCSSRVDILTNGCYNSDNSILIGVIIGIVVVYHDQASIDLEPDPVSEGINRMLSWVDITIFKFNRIWFSETFLTNFCYNGLT